MRCHNKQNNVFFPAEALSSYRVTPTLRSWLRESTSLTKRFRKSHTQDFYVKIISQGYQCPSLSEAKILGLAPGTLALVREVELRTKERLWGYGRSVYPISTLKAAPECWRKILGNKPLGDRLFREKSLRRLHLQVAKIFPYHQEHQWIRNINPTEEALWARRSLFTLKGNPFLIMEIFLPNFYEDLAHGKMA